jgi:hypothetical protein
MVDQACRIEPYRVGADLHTWGYSRYPILIWGDLVAFAGHFIPTRLDIHFAEAVG